MATRFLVSALAFMLVAAPGVTLAAADISIGPLEVNNCDAKLI